MKKCNYCKNEFEPIANRGTEQLYCSKACRIKAGNERYKQSLINQGNDNQKILGGSFSGTQQTATSRIDNVYQRTQNIPNGITENSDNKYLDRIEKLYEERYKERIAAFQMEQQLIAMAKNNELILAKLNQIDQEEDEQEEEEGFTIGGVLNFMERFPILQQPIANILSDERVKDFVISMIPEPQKQTNQ